MDNNNKLYIGWDEYKSLVINLAKKIESSKIEFDQILCLARGGLPVGDALSRIFKKPLAILFTSSYKEAKRGKLLIDNAIAKQNQVINNKILLVDDLVDSGETLKQVLDYLKDNYTQIEKIHTATIWQKAHSIYHPDFCVNTIPNECWLEQPFEFYDKIDLKDPNTHINRVNHF